MFGISFEKVKRKRRERERESERVRRCVHVSPLHTFVVVRNMRLRLERTQRRRKEEYTFKYRVATSMRYLENEGRAR